MRLARSELYFINEKGYSPWVRLFAWVPTKVENHWIWLEEYEQQNYYWGWGGCEEIRRLIP